jgi:hypothetical protein
MLPNVQGARAVTSQADHKGTQIGLSKRYSEESLGLELLCTKAGAGPLAVNGQQLTIKNAKPLPSSD